MTVDQLAYLKCPDRIRKTLIRYGEPSPSRTQIERILARRTANSDSRNIGEPEHSDGKDYRVRGLVKAAPSRRGLTGVTPEERARIAELVRLIPERPKEPVAVFRYKGPPPVYGSTAYADSVIERVCVALEMPHEVFLSGSRQKRVVAARALVVKVLRDRNADIYSYPRCAEIVGRKDHSTMINLVQNFRHYCTLFPGLSALFAELQGGEV